VALTDQQRSGFRPDAAALLAKLAENTQQPLSWNPVLNQNPLFGDFRTAQFLNTLEESDNTSQLPAFIKPLPDRIGADDVKYLQLKGALTLPSPPVQSALLKAYVEFVHPYMPLLELHDFLGRINSRDGQCGQLSLLLYQAVMFTGSAFVKSKFLSDAGFSSRRIARKAFFQRARVSFCVMVRSVRTC